MSENAIATELENSITYLRNARQAIINHGGTISPTAGLKDFAEAINKLPIGDNTLLLKVIDRSIDSLTAEDLDGLTTIGSYAFRNCDNLTSVAIPDSVTSIGSNAFYYCRFLKSATIGNGVTSIGTNAFYSCEHLMSIVIPDSVTSIGYGAFSWCESLYEITIPNGVKYIDVGTFEYCKNIMTVKFGSGIESIDSRAFAHCVNCLEYDFSEATSVPSLLNVSAFDGINASCSILVPQELADEWLFATNWNAYSKHIAVRYS